MVLTVTLSAGLTAMDNESGARQLLIAAIGCNLAWGIIDAVMYLMNCITVHSGKTRLVQAVQRVRDPSAGLALIQDEIGLHDLLDPRDVEALSQSIFRHIADARLTKKTLTREDWLGAVACFWLVFISCLPAALPFLFFSPPRVALRVSNLLLLLMLFLVGYKWARYTGTNAGLAGASMVGIGLALVSVAILLGG